MKKEETKLAVKSVAQTQVLEEPVEGASADLQPADIRTASEEQFEKAQRKTTKLHAALFERLSK